MSVKRSSLLAALLALLASPLLGETTDPELLEGSIPAYPIEAREAGIEGIVLVEALIDENGHVFAADVITSPSESLNAATLEAVKQWKFKPAEIDGQNVMKVVRIPVSFNLTDPVEDSLVEARKNTVAAR